MKKIIVLILLFAMTLSLFACTDGSNEETQAESTSNETEPIIEETDETEKKSDKTETEAQSNETESTTDVAASDTVTEAVIGETETESDSDTSVVTESETVSEPESTPATDVNTEGVTSEKVTEESVTEKETDEMESVVPNDGPASVGEYEKYNLDSYMTPIWDGQVVHNETVMFVGIDDKAPLLYDADKIISVRSYDLSIEYVEGVDYEYVDGHLVLLEGTRIPYVPLETYYSVLDPNYPYLSTMYNGQVTQTMFGEGNTMTKWQVAVTYKHTDTWDGPTIESYEDRYADFINKLENGEDVTVFFYGDSITTGANSSGGSAPYAPIFPRMFVQYVAKQYGYTVKYVDSFSDTMLTNGQPGGGMAHEDTVFGTNGIITYINTAVGGWSTQQGYDNYSAYVGRYIAEYGCDLFVLAFGMNNGGSSANEIANCLEQIVRKVYRSARDADVVLVSTMIPNPEAVRNPADTYYCNGNQSTFEEAMYPVAEKLNNNALNCAVAPMTSVSTYIHSQKRFRDSTGNNVNHPNDFLARTYAQVIYQTVFGYENYEEEPINLGEIPVVNANYNALTTLSGSEVYIDGKTGTTNANDALCVRVESTSGGYFMYYVSNGTKVYLNAKSGSGIEYGMSGQTVWTYNATLKAMVCEGSDIAIKLVTPEICLHPNLIDGDQHYREACVRCGVEVKSEPHSISEIAMKNPDGSTVYAMRCSICGYIQSSYTVPAGINQYYPLTGITLYNGTDCGIKTEGGVRYYRVEFTKGDGHILVNGINYTTAIDGDTGKYLVMKYRAAGNSRFSFDICTSDHEGHWSSVTKGSEKVATSWEIAVIDLAQFANYTCDSDLKAQVRITTASEYIEIAYIAITDTVTEAKTLMGGESFVLYTDWSGDGIKYEADAELPEDSTDDPEDSTDEPEEETVDSEMLASVGVYEEYNIDSYMSPIWDGKIVHNETVMFVGIDDKAPLLYDADKIISVRSYDLSIEYVEGVDYEYVDGYLVLLEGTRIPYVPLETYYSVQNDSPFLSTMHNGVVTQTMYGEGDSMCKWQVAVTYKHTDAWKGPKLSSYEDRFADLITKLENGEDVTIFFYGDSITAGANSSGAIGKSPYTPIWARMFTQYIAKQYGYTVKYVNSYADNELTEKPGGGGEYGDTVYGTNGTITYINNAVGGWWTELGIENFDKYVKKYIDQYGCDLFVLAFGMNNGNSTASEVAGLLEEIVDDVVASAPETDVLLVSTMIPNPEAVQNSADTYFCGDSQGTFETAMIPLAENINDGGTDCAVAPMTSVSQYLHSVKRFRDTTGNNVNHPNDFLVRLYAQTLFQTVFGYEGYLDGENELGETPVVNANYNAQITLSDNTLFLDGKDGTENANDAICVRLEACEGGYYLYYVSDGKIVYINESDGGIGYSAAASTVWTYDETAKAMVSDGGELSLVLVTPEICLHPTVAGANDHRREACIRCGVESTMTPHSLAESTTTNADGSVTYAYSCHACGVNFSSKTVPEGVNVYMSAFTLSDTANGAGLINYAEVISDGDGTYARIHGGNAHSEQNYNEFWPYRDTSASRPVTGQYLVIKYRVGKNGLGQNKITLYVGTQNNNPADEKERIDLYVGDGTTVEDNEWHIAVIDMSTMAGLSDGESLFKPSASDGQYRAKFISIRPFYTGKAGGDESDYMDIAFAAMCDSLDEAEALLEEGSYEYYSKSTTPDIVNINE